MAKKLRRKDLEAITAKKPVKEGKRPVGRPKKYSQDHLRKLTQKERGFVKDWVKTDNRTEAARRNYNVTTPNSACVTGSIVAAKPKIMMAYEAELAQIDDKYIENGLVGLEKRCEAVGDLGTQRGVYESMMKLKGLGSTKVVNENIEKTNFEFKDPTELAAKLIENILDMNRAGMLDINALIKELNLRKPKNLDGGWGVIKIEDESKSETPERSDNPHGERLEVVNEVIA